LAVLKNGDSQMLFRAQPDGVYFANAQSGAAPQEWFNLGGSTDYNPAVVGTNGQYSVFISSATGDMQVRSSTDARGWQSLGGFFTSGPGAYADSDGTVYLAGLGIDQQVYFGTRTAAGSFSGWQPVGGCLAGDPAISRLSTGELFVVARGCDNALWYRKLTFGWGPWTSLGGTLSYSPALAGGGAFLGVFATAPNANVYSKYVRADGQVIADWKAIGPYLISSPSVLQNENSHVAMTLYATGADDDGVYANRYDTSTGRWGGWTFLFALSSIH
jgi:alpha-galactosidase